MANLAPREFWDSTYQKPTLPQRVNMHFSFDRCLAEVMRTALLDLSPGAKALEIGAAPGKWMAFLSDLGLEVTGLELSESGSSLMSENLAILGVPANILVGDFEEVTPRADYDVVYSLGFLEHFTNPEEMLNRHFMWAKKSHNSRVIVGVPLFNNLHGTLQSVGSRSVLDMHNKAVMNPEFFRSASAGENWEVSKVDYLGSFEPALIYVDVERSARLIRRRVLQLLLRYAARARRLRIFDKFNSPRISSYMLVQFEYRDLQQAN